MADFEENKQLEIDKSELLSGFQISRIIEDAEAGQGQYLINKAYHEGKNPPIIKIGKDKKALKRDPNNIIPLPFGRRTVNDLLGYAYKPGNVTYKWSKDNNDESNKIVDDIFKAQEQPLESAEIFKDAAIKGEGAELVWFQDGEIKFSKVDRETCIFEYEDSIKEDTLKWAIRFYKVTEILETGDDRITHKADVYQTDRVDKYEWVEDKDLDRSQKKLQSTHDVNVNDRIEYKYIESVPHPFGKVPLHPYLINEDKLGVFEAAITIIDKLDELGSDSIANAIDQFNDTLLALSKKLDPATAAMIRESKVIDDLGGKDEGNFVEFIQRNLDITGTLESTKLFERWYYELTGIPNLNDEKFNTKSGIAIAFALVPFENLVTTMQIYFSKGLQYRLDLINNANIDLNVYKDPIEAELEWKRNLPFDLKERVDIVVAIKNAGLFSDETLLNMFPDDIIEDAEAEIEAVKKQKEENMAMFEGMQDMNSVTEPLEDDDDE